MRPGYKTSEFWITALLVLGLAASSIGASLSPKYAALGASISTAAYALSRGLAKLYPPKSSHAPQA